MVVAFLIALATPQVIDKPNSVQARMDALSISASKCKLEGASYVLLTNEPKIVRVLIPKKNWARRKEAEMATRLACVSKVVIEAGYRPVFLGLRH